MSLKRKGVGCALTALVAVGAMTSSPVALAAASGPAGITPEASVQVTSSPIPLRSYASPVVAVDPRNPDVIAVADGEARTSKCALQVSTDAGRTWREATTPQPPDAANCVRNTNGHIASLVFGADGTLYYAVAGYKPSDFHSQIYVGRSTDLGATFDTVAIPGLAPPYPADSFGTPALPSLAVDPTNANRIYVAWQANYGLFSLAATAFPPGKGAQSYPLRAEVSVSADGGRSFSPPVPVSSDPKDANSRAYMVVGKDGTVYVFSGQVTTPQPFGSSNPPPPTHLLLAISHDGAKTFTQKVIYSGPPNRPDDDFGVLLAIAPAVDIHNGNVYVAWEDSGVRPPAIMFMRSTDAGSTWSTPLKVNDAEPQRQWDFDEEDPMLSIAPNGRLDLAWGDYRDDPTFTTKPMPMNSIQNIYYATSSNSGANWAPNVRISDRGINRQLSDVWETGVHSAIGLVSLNNGVYTAWDDTRNAVGDTHAQDIYFTRVGLAGPFPIAARATSSTEIRYAMAGAGIALALVGLLLLIRVRRLTDT